MEMSRFDMKSPDEVLAEALDGRLRLNLGENGSVPVRCYADGSRPNKDLGEFFVEVVENGPVKSRLFGMGAMLGALLLVVSCRCHPDGTVKKHFIRQLINQCLELSSGRTYSGYLFRVRPDSVVLPTSTDPQTRISTKAVSVDWRQI